MAMETYSLCRPTAITFGKIPLEVFYVSRDLKLGFPYPAFQWLPLLPPKAIYVIVGVMGLSAITVTLGFCYRVSAATLFLTFGYLFAVERMRTYWNSHFYSELLVIFLLVWMPAARRFSLDAWLARKRPRPSTVPYWTLVLLRGQAVVMYFFGGVAKLNVDWLLDAEPVRYHLAHARLLSEHGSLLSSAQVALVKSLLQSDAFAYFIGYAGVVFDLGIGFLMLIRRTRVLGLILLVIFHSTNHFIIFNDIDWFPFLGLAAGLIFLDPDWPERFWSWLRRPQLAKPDWPWLVAGGVLVPVIGVALGWKLPPTPRPEPVRRPPPPARRAAVFVVIWLALQVLVPLRQFAIPGDPRFTWEGLSFSWRLKADVYRALPTNLTIEDRLVISQDPEGRARIDWNAWHGDRVVYRSVTPGHVNWSQLPELLILLEPITGERIIYNPFSGSSHARTETESRERVQAIWQELYGRQPQSVPRTFPFDPTISACALRLKTKGYSPKTPGDVVDLVNKLLPAEKDGEFMRILIHLTPFGLEGEPAPSSDTTPFLLVHDPRLMRSAGGERERVDLAKWVKAPYTRTQQDSGRTDPGGPPAVIYTGLAPDFELKDLLPSANIREREDQPDSPPRIAWNYLDELTVSQGMHISTQPFLLRQYARHVADLWEEDYGHRPKVYAQTQVSLNGRPFQALVDPQADLARVPAGWLTHNPWIRNLETPRIPGGVIKPAPLNQAGP
jgi:hypothetical protein